MIFEMYLGLVELICVRVYQLRSRGQRGGGVLWNIGTHPIVWNHMFPLHSTYVYLGTNMDLDGPSLFLFSLSFLTIFDSEMNI